MSLTTLAPKILLAVTGGISAYKSAMLARLLIKQGCVVRVMMTQGACEFITPLTFQALTGNEVHTKLLDEHAERGMGHIELAKWADVVAIVPASANTIAKLSNGLADNLVATVCLATTAPILIAPAMNQAMWHNAIVQHNIKKLERFGYHLITPESGEQACGDVGVGRLPEPEQMCDHILMMAHQQQTPQYLKGKTVIITAGATVEPIDPVRFLSNHSSGKMGFALAKACLYAGAEVFLVSGRKVALPTPVGAVHMVVDTAEQMLQTCQMLMQHLDDDRLANTAFVATAAVADYRLVQIAEHKIKKTADNSHLTLDLVKNPDILATIACEFPKAVMVGFAAETQDTENYAKGKLIAKHLDMIACNDVSDNSIGFGSDENAMTVFFADTYQKQRLVLTKSTKFEIAMQLVFQIAQVFDLKSKL